MPIPPPPLPIGEPALWNAPLNLQALGAHVFRCQTAAVNDRGDALECLAAWLFASLPGFSTRQRGVWAVGGASEVDLAVYNDPVSTVFPNLPDRILVECKNRGTSMESPDVAWFDWKLQLGGCQAGIIVTAAGLTGTQVKKSAAWSIIGKAQLADPPRRILVVTLSEIAALSSREDLRNLLIDKMSLLSLWTPQI